MSHWITAILLLAGGGFSFLASVGLVRMPDLYLRMQTSSKSGTLGVACILLGVAVHFGTLEVATRAILVVGFFFLTAPVAAHMIGRAAYFIGVPIWSATLQDDLKGRYNLKTHELSSAVSVDSDTVTADRATRQPDLDDS